MFGRRKVKIKHQEPQPPNKHQIVTTAVRRSADFSDISLPATPPILVVTPASPIDDDGPLHKPETPTKSSITYPQEERKDGHNSDDDEADDRSVVKSQDDGLPEMDDLLGTSQKDEEFLPKSPAKDNLEKNKENNSQEEKANEEENDEIEPPLNRIMRRKSVFAEAYNPEDEEDESERIIVHPKSDEQRGRLGENVKNIFLFRSLDHDQIGEVLDAMFERRVSANEYVIKQGDDGDNFYVIESGIYNIFVDTDGVGPPKLVGKYENSGSFGELALMYNLPRAATIQAVTEGSLWAMDRQTFRRIVLNAAYKKRKMYESLLEKVPMLKALQNYERMNLADALVPKMKTAGELIIKQGDAADGMYFVEEGSARVVMVNSDNQEKEISRVSVGGYFGELALVTKKPRAASVYAVDKVRLAFLDVEAFERLLGPCMDIMKRNIEDYENELLRIFGSKANISDIR